MTLPHLCVFLHHPASVNVAALFVSFLFWFFLLPQQTCRPADVLLGE
jgi:hypothetical protein